MKGSFGRKAFFKDYPLQSLGKIARPVDISSKKHRGFWVTERKKQLNAPKDSRNHLSTGIFSLYDLLFAKRDCRKKCDSLFSYRYT